MEGLNQSSLHTSISIPRQTFLGRDSNPVPVLGIRIQISMFLGFSDLDPLAD
jgi:hypothetical protein